MRALLSGALLLALVACSKPSPPTLTPKRVTVTYVSATALGLDVTLDATNENTVDLKAGNLTAHVVLDDHIEVGVATVEQTVTLPANQTTEIHVSTAIPWTDVVAMASLATSDRQTFPYKVSGNLELGGELLHATVPFQMDGQVGRDQIIRATLNSLPPIPGVNSPPMDAGSSLTRPGRAPVRTRH